MAALSDLQTFAFVALAVTMAPVALGMSGHLIDEIAAAFGRRARREG